MGRVRFGHNDDPRGIFIKTVDQTGPCPAADSGEIMTMGEEGMDQGSGVMTGRGVHHQTGRFVQDNDRRILIQDIQRDGFRDEFKGFRGGNTTDQVVAGADLVVRFDPLSVDMYFAFFNQTLDSGAGGMDLLANQVMVQSLEFKPGFDHQFTRDENLFPAHGRLPELPCRRKYPMRRTTPVLMQESAILKAGQ